MMQNSSIGSGPGAVPGLSAPPGPPPDNRSTSRVAERETPGDGQEIRTGAPMPPFSGPKCSPIGSTSDFFRAKTEFQIGRHTLSLPGERYVTYELQPCTLARMLNELQEFPIRKYLILCSRCGCKVLLQVLPWFGGSRQTMSLTATSVLLM